MTSVLFVHGTGVRTSDYEPSFKQVSHELLARRPDLQVLRCLWGDKLGSRLHAHGASIPLYDTTRSLQAVEDEDSERDLWSLLYQDPLFELRLLSQFRGDTIVGTSGRDIVLGRLSPGDELDDQVRSFVVSPTLQRKLDEMGIAQVFPEARVVVVNSAPYQNAIRTAPQTLGEYRAAIARTLAAQSIALCEQHQLFAANLWNAPLRDEIVTLLLIAFGDTERSIAGDLATLVIAHPLTLYLRHWRGKTTDAASLFPGDILLYQARGEPIRQFIREQIEQADPPVVLLAHSLGGIVCVDLLNQQESMRQQVHLLVTVGSQTPFLYEIGALQSLSPDQPLPPDFPSWLNIYDLNDFFSYIGASVFPDRVQDVLVDSGQPFPQAHGAYWINPATWNAIIPRLP